MTSKTMRTEHGRLRDLVLTLEELDGDERREAEAHLAACGACRALLDGVRRAEDRARESGTLPDLANAATYRLDEADRQEAEASLRALHERLGLERASATPARVPPKLHASREGRVFRLRPRPAHGAAALVAAAAVLIAVLTLWPRPAGPPPSLLGDARIAPTSTLRGVQPSGWHTGDAFVLELDLALPASLVVFHVDPSGRITRLHPGGTGVEPERRPAGRVTLPTAETATEWRFEGETGAETFVIAAIARPDRAREALAAGDAVAPGTRAERLRALQAALEKPSGAVRTIEVRHEP
jgi:hypothetical protein